MPTPAKRTPAPPDLLWAHRLVDTLAALGIERVVASPGSRSTPLTLAALRHPRIRTWMRLDERSAGFFALGLALADRRPVALIATSGSAPTHWFPAVVEAAQSRVPLILLTADRPPELFDCGANQTIDQTRLFGPHCRASFDVPPASGDALALRHLEGLAARAVETALWPLPGPVQLNVPLREPLTPGPGERFPPPSPPRPRWTSPVLSAPEGQLDRITTLLASGPGLIVCGPGAFGEELSEALTALAGALGCPILADPLSGLRCGPHPRDSVLTHYEAWLRDPLVIQALRPTWTLRLGAAPVAKALLGFLEGDGAGTQILVAPQGDRLDPGHRVAEVVRADPTAFCLSLRERVAAVGCQAGGRLDLAFTRETAARAAASGCDVPEARIVRTLMDHLPAGAKLFCGNSMPIRDLDAFSGSRALPLSILCNRGVSGIDGQIATLLGLATADSGPVTGLIGDLAFWHDHGTLLDCAGITLTLVVVQNGGGGIFGYLPQAVLPEFERAWLTPVGCRIEDAARLYQASYCQTTPDGLAGVLARPGQGVRIVEVRVDRHESLARHRAYWQAQS